VPQRAGFTLVETMLAMIIVGTAVLASMTLLGVGTQTNKASFQLVTALNLSETVRERMHGVDFEDALDENGSIYSPPLDVRGVSIPELPDWSQELSVVPVPADSIDETTTGSSDMANLTVTVLFRGKTVATNSYLLVKTPDNN
jgi:type II secretory pathway pseudopilin PulG